MHSNTLYLLFIKKKKKHYLYTTQTPLKTWYLKTNISNAIGNEKKNPNRLKALALIVLKSYIAIFSTINTKKHAAMVEEKLKNLIVELQCTCTVVKIIKNILFIVLIRYIILLCCLYYFIMLNAKIKPLILSYL